MSKAEESPKAVRLDAPQPSPAPPPVVQLPIMPPVKIHGMPPSSNAMGPCILAAYAECGGFEMCNHHCPTAAPNPVAHHCDFPWPQP
jgi:hypothetical protein